MNELPEMPEQIKNYLMKDPSPFVHYDEESKKFLDEANPIWKQVCMKKFDWVRREVEQDITEATSVSLASLADKRKVKGLQKNSLADTLLDKQQPGIT